MLNGLSKDVSIKTDDRINQYTERYFKSAHFLLNLLDELRKIEKKRGLPSTLSLFRNEFNKFNNKRARMLDSIYHMTLRSLPIAITVTLNHQGR